METIMKVLKLNTYIIRKNILEKPEGAKSGYMVYSNNNLITFDICLTNDFLEQLFNKKLKDDEWMNIQYIFRLSNVSEKKGGGPEDFSKKICTYISKILIIILISLKFGSVGPVPLNITEDSLVDFNCSNPFGKTEIEKLDESYIAPLTKNMKLLCNELTLPDKPLFNPQTHLLSYYMTFNWDGNRKELNPESGLLPRLSQPSESLTNTVMDFILMEDLQEKSVTINVDLFPLYSGIHISERWHSDSLTNRQLFMYIGDGKQTPFAKVTTFKKDKDYKKPNASDIVRSSKKGCDTVTVISDYKNMHINLNRESIYKDDPNLFKRIVGMIDHTSSGQALLRINYNEFKVKGGLKQSRKKQSRKQNLKYKKKNSKKRKQHT